MAKVMEGLKTSRNYSMVLELFTKMPSLGVNRDSRHVSHAVTVSMKFITFFDLIRPLSALKDYQKLWLSSELLNELVTTPSLSFLTPS